MWSQNYPLNLLSAVTTTPAAGATKTLPRKVVKNARYFLKAATYTSGTATIKIQGSVDGGTTWIDITTISVTNAATSTGSAQVLGPFPPLIRGNLTAWATDGVYTLDIVLDLAF